MKELFEVFSQKPKFTIKGDFVDSLHSKRTVIVFLAFAILVAVKQFDEDSGALACWLSGSLSDEQVDYVHQLCWVNSTYYFPGIEDPDDFHHERRFAIPYYQFILFILVGQAFSFYLPNYFWNFMASDYAAYISTVLDQISMVKHYTALVEKEKEHEEKMAKKREKEKLKRLVKRTVDEANSKKSSQTDIYQQESGGVSRQKAASRKASKESAASKQETAAMFSQQQRVNMDAAEKRVSILEGGSSDESTETEDLQQPLSSDLLTIFESETFNELQESLAPISRMRPAARAIRKTAIDMSRERMKTKKKKAGQDEERSAAVPLRRHVQAESQDVREQQHEQEEEEEQEDKRRLLKRSRRKLGKIIRRPIDSLRNLTTFYLLYKLANLANILVQFYLLTYVFGNEFYTFGVQFINRVFINPETSLFSTKQFPIITFCDFFVYQNLRQTHFNTAQCLLHINVIIEKFYIVIWFWLIALFFITLFNIISWIIEIYVSSTSFLLKYITIKEKILNSNATYSSPSQAKATTTNNPKFSQEIADFKRSYLGHDGVLMMQMIKNLSGPIWFMDILYNSWANWLKEVNRPDPRVQLDS